MKGRVNNVIRIPTSLSGNFFRIWVEFLTPLHNLTNKEKDVVAAFLKTRYNLSKSITDDKLLDKVVITNSSVKEQVKQECGISNAFFTVIMGKLKKTSVIADNRINPKFIPKNINEKDGAFSLLLYFDLNENNN